MVIKFINAKIVDVIQHKITQQDLIIKDDKIVFIGKNCPKNFKANKTVNLKGKWICPSFIDGHMHIESSMLTPYQFAMGAVKHGTCAIMADPHEMANVAGTKGVDFMLEASKDLPIDVFIMFPSCVPATRFDESKQEIHANEIKPYLKNERILGLGEMMDYEGVINKNPIVLDKIAVCTKAHKIVDGHAPGLLGDKLKKYVKLSNIRGDHECSTLQEALERIQLGVWVMIRQGSAAKNLKALLPLFDSHPNNCLLVTDDINAADLLNVGHIDQIIKEAIKAGKDPITAIKFASYNAAKCFNLKNYGAIAKDYKANFCILDDLNTIKINQVYKDGKLVFDKNKTIKFKQPKVRKELIGHVSSSINVKPFAIDELKVKCSGKAKTRVIEVIPGELITKQKIMTLDYSKNNGIDISKDILKVVVVERHNASGHIAIGYIHGLGLKHGAIASTVSHDSHNIIAIGCSDEEIMLAIKKIIAIKGGNVIVKGKKVINYLDLKICGLLTDLPVKEAAKKIKTVRETVYSLGVPRNIEPFMNMAFLSLPVIPDIKITPKGLVDVTNNKLLSLLVKEK